jgi:polar amino acid transport system substrate-binding protein
MSEVKATVKVAWLAAALLIGIIIGAAGCYFIAAPGPAPAEKPSYVELIKQRGKLIVGTSADWPPFEYIDAQGNYAGIDMVLAKKIAEALGVELEIKDMKFAALIEALKGGHIDIIIADMHPTAEREKIVDFTLPYYAAYEMAVVALKNKVGEFTAVESLYGKKIGVQLGTIQEDWAKKNLGTKSEIISYDRVYPEMVMSLKRGDLDAIIVGDVIASVLTSKDPDLAVAMRLGTIAGAAVAVPQGAEDLKYAINKLIEDLIDSGEMDKIFSTEISKWLEQA